MERIALGGVGVVAYGLYLLVPLGRFYVIAKCFAADNGFLGLAADEVAATGVYLGSTSSIRAALRLLDAVAREPVGIYEVAAVVLDLGEAVLPVFVQERL